MTSGKSLQTPSPEEIVRHVAEYSTPVEREKTQYTMGVGTFTYTDGSVINFVLKAGKYIVVGGDWDGMELTFSD